jgi:bifunctional enzyme CysN/CysC
VTNSTEARPIDTAAMTAEADGLRERAHIVIVGHVDHGKSTIMGRLLADTGSLPDGKLEQVRRMCERTSRPFEYAFLLDALKDEQAQGITIDAARVFFRSARRDYLVIDAPGHVEFVKNMVTGAARAEAALLVVDAAEGVQQNSRRHASLLGLLGVRQVVVLVNKMDLVEYRREAFDAVVRELEEFLPRVDVAPAAYVPVSGREGDNVAAPTSRMPWYNGPTTLDVLDSFKVSGSLEAQPFRMPVQDVYKFTARGDDRRIVAGTVEAGVVPAGAEVVVYPSGKRSRVASLEAFNGAAPAAFSAGMAAGFTLTEQVYVARGDLVARADEPAPRVATRFRARLFWLGREPLVEGREYLLRINTARVRAWVERIERVLDTSTFEPREGDGASVERHDVAQVVLATTRPVALDLAADSATTGRFVLVDDFEIRGGGIVHEVLDDAFSQTVATVVRRNTRWEQSWIASERRASRYGQRPCLILVTGDVETLRKDIAKTLESRLFELGRSAYYIGMRSVVYGMDADLERATEHRQEHLRRLAEIAHLMLDAGFILIVSAADVTRDELETIKLSVGADAVITVLAGDTDARPLPCDVAVSSSRVAGKGAAAVADEAVRRVQALLEDRGVVFRP